MKTLKLLALGIALLIAGTTQAQVSLHINLGTPPQWGPAGYSEVQYYYLPDVEAYYDVESSMFIYFGNGVWVRRSTLPEQYRDYDLYSGYKVVMTNYHGNRPQKYFRDHKRKYARGYRGHHQRTIGNRPGNWNREGKKHYEGNSRDENKHDNGWRGNDKKDNGNNQRRR